MRVVCDPNRRHSELARPCAVCDTKRPFCESCSEEEARWREYEREQSVQSGLEPGARTIGEGEGEES